MSFAPSGKTFLRVRRVLLRAAIALPVLACATSRKAEVSSGRPDVELPSGGGETVSKEPNLDVYEGTLARTVEEGGWILRAGDKEYLLLGTSPYRDQVWFREGTRVEVRGREQPAAMTIYMQGIPFRVEVMKPLGTAPERPQ